jgi:hypothetical protein
VLAAQVRGQSGGRISESLVLALQATKLVREFGEACLDDRIVTRSFFFLHLRDCERRKQAE